MNDELFNRLGKQKVKALDELAKRLAEPDDTPKLCTKCKGFIAKNSNSLWCSECWSEHNEGDRGVQVVGGFRGR